MSVDKYGGVGGEKYKSVEHLQEFHKEMGAQKAQNTGETGESSRIENYLRQMFSNVVGPDGQREPSGGVRQDTGIRDVPNGREDAKGEGGAKDQKTTDAKSGESSFVRNDKVRPDKGLQRLASSNPQVDGRRGEIDQGASSLRPSEFQNKRGVDTLPSQPNQTVRGQEEPTRRIPRGEEAQGSNLKRGDERGPQERVDEKSGRLAQEGGGGHISQPRTPGSGAEIKGPLPGGGEDRTGSGVRRGEGGSKGGQKSVSSSSSSKGRVAYTGSADAYGTMRGLQGLLGGMGGYQGEDSGSGGTGGEVPFSTTPPEASETWNTGFVSFTGDTPLEKAKMAALEHRQRVIKTPPDKVEYDKWEPIPRPIYERFVSDTKELVGLAQQIIESARLPRDPRGIGTPC